MNYFAKLPSPVGELTICATDDAITTVAFPGDSAPLDNQHQPNDLVRRAMDQLKEYFNGQRKAFDLPLNPTGTAFQKSVWQALLAVPYGKTASYGEIAAEIGNAKASRAVGLANGRNPIAIVVPCHRIIGSDGSLTGYGGGLHRKHWLLTHERGARPLG